MGSALLNFLAQELGLVLGQRAGSAKIILVRLFVFILIRNLGGLLPYVFTPHRHLSVTLSIGLPFWAGFMLFSSVAHPSLALAHLVPTGTPNILIPFIILIELISNLIRPLTLRIRLAANIVAGHLLLNLLRLPAPTVTTLVLACLGIPLVLLTFLELGVSFIQSYVFITLSSLYISEVNRPGN